MVKKTKKKNKKYVTKTIDLRGKSMEEILLELTNLSEEVEKERETEKILEEEGDDPENINWS